MEPQERDLALVKLGRSVKRHKAKQALALAEIERLKRFVKRCDSRIDDRKQQMEVLLPQGEKFKDEVAGVSLYWMKPQPKLIVDENNPTIKQFFTKERTEAYIDKAEIKLALLEGNMIEGASLEPKQVLAMR